MSQSNTTKVIKNSFIFSGLNDDELSELVKLAIERNFMSNEFIFWDGDSPDWFYIIAEGRVKIVKHSSSGKDFIVAFFQSGEMFGEVALFENKPYPASAQAITETRLVAIKREEFLTFLANQPQVALRIINVLGERLREAQNRLRNFAGERVEQRLANVLLMLFSKMGSTLPFTRQEIADMTGTATETTIRIMSQLKDRGIISSTRGKIIIVDKEKLRLLSEGPPQV